MATLVWRATSAAASPNTPVVVMASRFELASARHVPRFLYDSLRIRRQVLRATGALGVSLVARPLQREFRTLSAWTSNDAITQFVRQEPHRSAMRRHRAAMATAQFVFWDATATDLPINWHDAMHRLETASEHPSR